ncbi:MAG: M48 family metallopeptidase [Lautropia sp.]
MASRARQSRKIPLLRSQPPVEQPRITVVQRANGPWPVAYSLRRSTRKTIGFQIDDRGLTISAPRWVPIREIEAAIQEKNRWIVQKQAEWRAFERARARSAPRYADGGHIRLLGRRVTLRCNPYTDRYKRTHFLLADEELWIAGPGVDDAAWIEAKVTGWIKQQARGLFEARLAPFADRLGRRPTQLALSSARSRWGSCSRDGKILLSWRLMHFPMHIIDYVIAHEVAHLKEMNHGPRFWSTLERIHPGFHAARDELHRYPDGLLPP